MKNNWYYLDVSAMIDEMTLSGNVGSYPKQFVVPEKDDDHEDDLLRPPANQDPLGVNAILNSMAKK